MNKIYGSIITAKTGTAIPLFISGRSLESRYNPENDSERLLGSIKFKTRFFLVMGVGSGIFIKKLLEKNNVFVLAVENSNEDIVFLNQLEAVKEIKKNPQCKITTIEKLESDFCSLYVPAFYGDFEIIEQRAWINEINERNLEIKHNIQNALDKIRADYSVQVHFGKLWQNNIRENLFFISSHADYSSELEISNKKKAYVIAAGPSLDKTILKLKNKRDEKFIISTDTAFSSLLCNGITPDFVVSIDGQHISQKHFSHNNSFEQINFLFDLTSNPSAVRHVYQKGGKIHFCRNFHPLSALSSDFFNEDVPVLFSGSGTVTITALDFAIKSGFSEIYILGADFSYLNNKAYSKGTYLDNIYQIDSYKLKSHEQNFTKLFFRTHLNKLSDNKFSSDVLDSYKVSMENYLYTNKIIFSKEENIYKLENHNQIKFNKLKKLDFDLKSFLLYLKDNTVSKKNSFQELSKLELSLLPAAAYFRNQKNINSDKTEDFLKLAYYSLVGYN